MVLTIPYESEAELTAKLREALLNMEDWTTISQLGVRYGVTRHAMWQRIRRWRSARIVNFEDEQSVKRGATGRIRLIKVTPELKLLMEELLLPKLREQT